MSRPPGTAKACGVTARRVTIPRRIRFGVPGEAALRLVLACPQHRQLRAELFYEGLLTSKPGLENQRLTDAGDLNGSGLHVLEVRHDKLLVRSLLAIGAKPRDPGRSIAA